MISKLSKALNFSENFFAFIASLLLIIATISVILEVFSRQFFNYSFTWVHEINEYILLYIPFLTAAWLLRSDDHIVIDLIENYISLRVKYILDIAIGLIGIFVSIILIWYGIITVSNFVMDGVRSQTNLRVPQGYIVAIIPIGSFLLLLEFIRRIYRTIYSIK